MVTTLLLDQPTLDQTGLVTIRVECQIAVEISAREAQRRVNRYVHWEISSQMHAEEPCLVVGTETFWRVPIHLTFPAFGDVGCVGYMKVDPVTGGMNTSPAILQYILEKAEELALRFTSPTTQPI